MSKKSLLLSAISKFGIGMLLLGLLLFLCAGTIRYWNAWLYLASLAVPMMLMGAFLFLKDPELLQKRLGTKEKESAQKAYILLSSTGFLSSFALCGLDYRFGWSQVPFVVVLLALLVMLAGYGLFWTTLMQNRYASRVVEVQAEQRVIDTGVYAIVRHPMYTASILMFLFSPLVLGSYYAILPMLLYVFSIVRRIGNEEEVLASGLAGYAEYTKKVKYRLFPFVW